MNQMDDAAVMQIEVEPVEAGIEFEQLVAEVGEGSQDAAWRLIELYGPHIRRVVRRILDRRLRSQFDSIDFVQAVWASFFKDPLRMRAFSSPDEIIGFLAALARNKVIDESRRRLRSKRWNVRREQRLHAGLKVDASELAAAGRPAIEVAIAREAWNRMMNGQPPHYQKLVMMRFSGATYPEIADQLHINERTVRKVIDKLLKSQTA